MRIKLIKARDKKKIRKDELAKALGVSVSTIYKVEGGNANPSLGLAKKWAEQLKIPEKKVLEFFFDD